MHKVCAALVLCGVLSACGFKPRGSDVLPEIVSSLSIQSEYNTRFSKALHEAMRRRGVTLQASEASAQLKILRDESGQRVLSVTATEGPEEYEVFQVVTFSLLVDSEPLIDAQTLTLTRDYTYDRESVLSKHQEYESLRKALADEMAETVIRKIRYSQ